MNPRTHFGLALLLTATLAAAPVRGEDRRTYTWLTVGQPSGQQTVLYKSDNTIDISFEFNDRGRGPETRTVLELNEHGAPVHLRIRGKNYRKGAVDERLDVANGKFAWSSSIERGESNLADRAFYWPNNAPPELLAVLARAILDSPDGGVTLLPTGRATLETLGTTTLQDTADPVTITLYGINGLDTSTTYVWLDEDLQFFGVDYGWFGITREGFEAHIETLKRIQSDATDAFYERASKAITTPLDGLLVIAGARLFDSLVGALTAPATVFVFDGRISAIYFDKVAVPDDATVIDAAGHTLLPTLWDMHAHVSIGSFFNYLAVGATNVRDMANDHDRITKLRADVRSGRIAGPDLYALGFIDKRGEFSAPTGRLADTLDDARRDIDFYAQHGYLGIKLYSSIEPDWVAPLARHAHERGLTVQGHVPAFMSAAQAIDAGYDEITHINMVLLNFLGAASLDTRTPTRFVVPGEQSGNLDLTSAAVRDFVQTLNERDIAVDPTLGIFMDMFLNEPGQVSWLFRDIADHLPATARRSAIAAVGFNSGKEEQYQRAAATTLALTRQLHEAGVRLLPGTDSMLPGFALIRELAYYVEAGIPANEVLQLATIVSARHLGQDQRLGSVTVGKEAHVYLVEGDPLRDLDALYRTRHVIKGRHLYFAPDVLRSQGFMPF